MNQPYWEFSVKGYSSAKHQCGRYGVLLLHTTHRGESSMQIEVEAWKTRMKRDGDVAYIEIIDHRIDGGPMRTIHADFVE